MPLQSSGAISMSQINAEFGRGTNLNSYRGTQYYLVSSGPFNFPSGTIKYSDFYGTQLNSSFIPFTDTYDSGSGTVTAPSGATSCTIKVWGGGGSGGSGYPSQYGAGGGGSGGYSERTSVTVTGGSTQFSYSVGVGGVYFPFSSSSGSTVEGLTGDVSTIDMSAEGGGHGRSYPQSPVGGQGGVASGGTTNTTGNSGENGGGSFTGGAGGSAPNGGSGGAGGVNDAGSNGSAPGGGGGGGGEDGGTGYGGGNGAAGRIQFIWS